MTSSDVVPHRVELQRVHRAEVRYGLPRRRDTAFVANVGLLQPGIGVLHRELATWGAMK